MPAAIYCELCMQQIAPNTRRVMAVAAESGNGEKPVKRLAAFHDDCWDRMRWAVVRYRRQQVGAR